MATLLSPGVSVTITDESQYLPAPTNSIPFVLLATAENKLNPGGTGIAMGTTSANANKLYRVTSQRDLVNLYGNPFFYTSNDGTPINGYELNEYGLLAAYSALGASNSVYCLRADIDMAELIGQVSRPNGSPDSNQLWLDTSLTQWGLYQFNSTTGQFTLKQPIVITDSGNVSNGLPLNTIGNIGDYAVIAIPTYDAPTTVTGKQFFYKSTQNTWVAVGSDAWLNDIPTVQASNSSPILNVGDEIVIGLSSSTTVTATIAVPSSPNNTVSGLAAAINALGWAGLKAEVVSGRLNLYSIQVGDSVATPKYISIVSGTNDILDDLGLTTGTYNQPEVYYGRSWQQPLWQSSQAVPRPTGSVWIKVGASGNGLNPVISEWDSVLASWTSKNVALATSDWTLVNSLDATGGGAIPAGTVYAQYGFNEQLAQSPIYYWRKTNSGPTVVTGTIANPTFDNGPYDMQVRVSIPGSSSLSGSYNVTLSDNSDAEDFVTAWSTANIPFTTATINSSGAIVLTHTAGGVISIATITSIMADAGFIAGTTSYVKNGPLVTRLYFVEQDSTSGIGTGVELQIINNGSRYQIPSSTSIIDPGEDYAIGDTITISGASLGGTSPSNDLVVKVTSVDGDGGVTGIAFVSGTAIVLYSVLLSPWEDTNMIAQSTAIVGTPANETKWFYSSVDQVDIMVNYDGNWRGYKNQNYDANGFPTPTGSNTTDPNGPIISASAPSFQSDGTVLVYGDLWIDTSDLENYPIINRWQQVDGEDRWVRIDNTDQISPAGVLFSDVRWATNGSTNPSNGNMASIVELLTSDYKDLDAPSAALYPTGMLVFNTRRSGYNVKEYRRNYFNSSNFPNQSLPSERDAWVSVSGLQGNGSPYMGRKAQRALVVRALKSAIDTNSAIRDEDNFFNLIAAPGYPELQPNMIVLNGDRGETAFIIGDTPMRLPEQATALQNWATNANGASSTGEEGLVTRNTYMGLFYPSAGQTSDLSGNTVVVPASHMMIRTFLRNDSISYPWLAAAGTRRGVIDNAASIGYIDALSGEFVSTKTSLGIRDVLYTNAINPLVFFTGNGLVNYGNKSSFASQSALDRINVARLIAFIRRQATIAARPFVFEPNDALTRQQLTSVIQTLMVDLVAKRGITDYICICDETNNTPARIDRNELWLDLGIIPTKTAEMIYIPVRVLNTGELNGVQL